MKTPPGGVLCRKYVVFVAGVVGAVWCDFVWFRGSFFLTPTWRISELVNLSREAVTLELGKNGCRAHKEFVEHAELPPFLKAARCYQIKWRLSFKTSAMAYAD